MIGVVFKIFQNIQPKIGILCNNCKKGKYIEIKKHNTFKLRCTNCGYEPPNIKPIRKII